MDSIQILHFTSIVLRFNAAYNPPHYSKSWTLWWKPLCCFLWFISYSLTNKRKSKVILNMVVFSPWYAKRKDYYNCNSFKHKSVQPWTDLNLNPNKKQIKKDCPFYFPFYFRFHFIQDFRLICLAVVCCKNFEEWDLNWFSCKFKRDMKSKFESAIIRWGENRG